MHEESRTRSLFREVNDRIADVSLETWRTSEPVGFLCECGDPACLETIDLTVADYEAIRSETTRFLVRAGHESPEFEDVLERIDGCLVVEDRAFERLREAS
jgi:hypothetical protein